MKGKPVATKNTQKKKQKAAAAQITPKEAVFQASLSLAATMPWDVVTLTDIADGAGLTLAELSDLFEDKTDILIAYGRVVDRKVMERCADPDPSLPEKDRLFEIFMERFDVLNTNRLAIVSILKSLLPDPGQAVVGLPHIGRSMGWMLETAGIETQGLRGAARIVAASILYVATLKVWMEDESEDLSTTMSALDKNLGRAAQVLNFLKI